MFLSKLFHSDKTESLQDRTDVARTNANDDADWLDDHSQMDMEERRDAFRQVISVSSLVALHTLPDPPEEDEEDAEKMQDEEEPNAEGQLPDAEEPPVPSEPEPPAAELDTPFPCELIDISQGGIQLRCQEYFPVGSGVSVSHVQLMEDQESFQFTCMVRWVRRVSGGQWRYGLEFTDLSNTTRDALVSSIFALQRQEINRRRSGAKVSY